MEAKNTPTIQNEANKKAVTNSTFMRDLVDGTMQVQSKAEAYLHKYNMEDSTDYQDRLKNSEVLPATAEAIKSITGKLLLKDTTLEDINELFDINNIDNAGTSFSSFEHKLTNDSLTDGLSFILVDYPSVTGVQTVAQKQALNAKPFYSIINSTQILNFRTEIINNETKLSQITIKTTSLEPDGDFGEKAVDKYLVYKNQNGIVTVDKWGENNGEVTKLQDTISITGVKEIPLVPFYTGKTGYLEGKSPLFEMGVLNYKWYRVNSALSRTLERGCDATPVIKGQAPLDDNGEKQELSVGSSQMLLLDEDSSFEWVGIDSSIIAPVENNIKSIEDRMAGIATQVLNSDTEQTATEVKVNNTDTQAKLGTFKANRENALNKAYELWCMFAGVPITGMFKCNEDFSDTKALPAQSEQLLKDHLAGIITKETYIKERQLGGNLTSIEDIDKEIKDAEAQHDEPLDNQTSFNE